MLDRLSSRALFLAALLLPIAGCTNSLVDDISVSPTTQSVAVGQTAQFNAYGLTGHGTTHPGTVADITTQVTWTSSSPGVATISAAGVATGVSAGTTTITASTTGFTGLLAATATLTVSGGSGSGTGTTSGVTALTITPSSQTVAAPGNTAQFIALGTTATGSVDLTTAVSWRSSSAQIATVNAAGLAMAVGQGTDSITAVYTNPGGGSTVAGTATFTVTSGGAGGGGSASVTSIAVIPGSQTVAGPNDTTQFLAIGTTGSGGTTNLTTKVAWSSSSPQIATIGANTGLATAVGQGSATITAVYNDPTSGNTITGTATFTVSAGTTQLYTKLQILPATQTLASGGTGQFVALATQGTTGFEVDVTGDTQLLTWQSSTPAIASISATGLATGKGIGTSNITAELQNGDGSIVSATATVSGTNTPPSQPIVALNIIPSSISVNDFQMTGQFLAIATLSSAPYVEDVTNSPGTTWISTEPDLFPINTNSGGNSGASAGLITAYGIGSVTLLAEAATPIANSGTPPLETIQTATATFSCPQVLPLAGVTNPSCYPNEPPPEELLATLTIYNEGLNTSNWLITAASATGVADVLHCGPGWNLLGNTTGSVCTITYPIGTQGVLLKAEQINQGTLGGTFGGWSFNCNLSDSTGNTTNPPAISAAGPNYCVAPLNGTESGNAGTVQGINTTVGAIFN